MSNEEYVEEMFYNAYESGSIEKFREEISHRSNESENTPLFDVIEEVYYEMKKNNQITEISQ